MSESRATGWPSGAPTAAQIKEFFGQIDRGMVTKDNLQAFLQQKPTPPVELSFPIEELGLGVRAYNCLKIQGIEIIADLVGKTEKELMRIPNFGLKSVYEVREALAAHGLALKDEELPDASHQKAGPELNVKSAIVKLFELIKLLDVKIDLTHKIAEHREMEKRWEAEEASGSWGGDLAGSEMRASHRQNAEKISAEISDTSAEINAMVDKFGEEIGTKSPAKNPFRERPRLGPLGLSS